MSKSLARSRPLAKPSGAKPRASARKTTSRAKKVSLTVDENVLHEVARDAKRAGRTLSAYVTEALARDLRRKRLQELIDEYESEHGTITEQELAKARVKWQD
jgi:post-segregation antitoxin (ccd killing protein)